MIIIKYENIVKGTFIDRPNRFIANCMVGNEIVKCHVKNTGRCKELLIEGVDVYLEENNNPNRKTKYSLISVQKGDRLINMDSQVPNKVIEEALRNRVIKLPNLEEEIEYLKAEKTYKNSRFDFYFETQTKKGFIEVKGVTLEENGIARFPDAPTKRGVKHIHELIETTENDYMSYIIFLIQMENINYFEPNDITHIEFGNALRKAYSKGVEILVYDSKVTPTSIEINKPVPIKLIKGE